MRKPLLAVGLLLASPVLPSVLAQCATPPTWNAIVNGGQSLITGVAVTPQGMLYASADYTVIPGLPGQQLARWDGTNWSGLGAGLYGAVNSLAIASNGDLLIGGAWLFAGGVWCPNVTRWNGSNFALLGSSVNGEVIEVAGMPNGDIVAAGLFGTAGGQPVPGLARWDGAAWSSLGGASGAGIYVMAAMPNGDLLVGGNFTSIGGVSAQQVARWDGSAWHAMGAGIPDQMIFELLPLPGGDVIAACHQHVRRWNGTAWLPIGTLSGFHGSAYAAARLPGGDVLICGGFTSVTPPVGPALSTRGIARLDLATNTWSDIGSTVAFPATWPLPTFYGVAAFPDGRVALGGSMPPMFGAPSTTVATVAPGCPAAAIEGPPACTGGSAPSLAASTMPWLGATATAVATGLPPLSLAVVATGFAPAGITLPFTTPLVCALQNTADVLQVSLPMAGSVTIDTPLPRSPSLAGMSFHQQVIGVTFPGGGIQLTATNDLRFDLGWF